MAATTDKAPGQELLDLNVTLMNTVIDAGYKAQTRSLNLARVLVEGAGRQQESGRKVFSKLADTNLPWYSPERYNAFVGLLVELQNEALRTGREYIDELNAAAADSRHAVETLVKHSGKVREAQQAAYSEGIAGFRRFAETAKETTAKA